MPRPKGNGPGWGGPPKGTGWGGPARGAHEDPPRNPPFEPGNQAHSSADLTEREKRYRALRKIERRERAEILEAVLYDIALCGNPEDSVRVMAAERALDRIRGKPVQTNINSDGNSLAALSDDELQSELARVSRAASSSAAGNPREEVPD